MIILKNNNNNECRQWMDKYHLLYFNSQITFLHTPPTVQHINFHLLNQICTCISKFMYYLSESASFSDFLSGEFSSDFSLLGDCIGDLSFLGLCSEECEDLGLWSEILEDRGLWRDATGSWPWLWIWPWPTSLGLCIGDFDDLGLCMDDFDDLGLITDGSWSVPLGDGNLSSTAFCRVILFSLTEWGCFGGFLEALEALNITELIWILWTAKIYRRKGIFYTMYIVREWLNQNNYVLLLWNCNISRGAKLSLT